MVLVLGAALVRHFGALGAPFFADDYLFLEQVRGRTLLQALLSPDPIGNFLRPVSRPLYFWTLTRLGGESPGFFHLVNLGLFLIAAALLFGLVRRLAGLRAAVIATAFLALHYAADVTIQWSSGSQDLLALVGALGTISLYLAGRRLAAAVALALALLSKEGVCLLPLIAILVDPVKGQSLRTRVIKAWPLLAVTALWAVVWAGTWRLRPAAASVMKADLSSLPAALLHLVQVSLGLEFPSGPGRILAITPLLVPLAMVLAATALVYGRSRPTVQRANSSEAVGRGQPAHFSGAVGRGLGWSVLGALPVAAVASIWSAYFYVFALCGVALAIGAWTATRQRWLALLVVALLTVSSERARQIDEFATGKSAWTPQSHVNRFYVDRAIRRVSRYLADLRRQRPTLPRRSTLFYANVPALSGWQAGDGALLRWAYRDTTLRSYYLANFSLRQARRGPFFLFVVENDELRDHTRDPLLLKDVAFSMLVHRKAKPAADALTLELERRPHDQEVRYWLAWAQWANGDTAAACRSLASSGVTPLGGPSPELQRAARAIALRDTAGAVRALVEGRDHHGLDPEIHARLAALLLPQESQRTSAVVEAFAVTALAPQWADGWRRLAAGQLYENQYGPAAESLRRYFTLGGQAAKRDAEAREVMASLMRVLPGGDVAQAYIRD